MAIPLLSSFFAGFAADATSSLARAKAGSSDVKSIDDVSATSLVEFTNAARVEPICVVDTRLTGFDFLTDVMKMLNSRYAAMYLAAGSLLGDTGKIKTIRALEKINPSRHVGYSLANTILSNASVDVQNYPVDLTTAQELQLALEHKALTLPKYDEVNQTVTLENDNPAYTTGSNISDGNTVSNLSVGQLVTLNISDGEAKREVPVTVRLLAYPTDSRTLTTILKWSEKDNSFKARYRAWKAGELSGWRDLIFMRDVYVERKKALMQDKSGLFRTLTGRVNRNMIAGLASMTPSVGTISSIAVIHEDTVYDLENEIDGKLSNFSVRQRIMNATGLMIIAVVDPQTEMVTVYTYTQAIAEEYSVKQIKGKSKGGDDITEIMKMLVPARPSF